MEDSDSCPELDNSSDDGHDDDDAANTFSEFVLNDDKFEYDGFGDKLSSSCALPAPPWPAHPVAWGLVCRGCCANRRTGRGAWDTSRYTNRGTGRGVRR